MTEQEIAKLMNVPFEELAVFCQDPDKLSTVISIAINIGIRSGREQAHRYYNQMFRDYKEVSIRN